MTDKPQPTADDIWRNLSQVDVSDHIETKKGGKFAASYLSWTWAWALLMAEYPEATFEFDKSDHATGREYFEAPDGSAEVRCTVSIGDVSRTMWLPVMDAKFNSVTVPTAREISDAKMRCLVKCLALFGLGFSLYSGEDVPEPAPRGSAAANDAVSPQFAEQFELLEQAGDYESLRDVFDRLYRGAKNRGQEQLMHELKVAYDARKNAMGGY